MRRLTSIVAIVVLAGLGRSLLAGEPCGKPLGCELRCAHCQSIPCSCPDDYCRKPLPCISCVSGCGHCDDYCRKPCPSIRCFKLCGGCNDYCPKPFPRLCWPVDPQWYRCPPAQQACCPQGSAPSTGPERAR